MMKEITNDIKNYLPERICSAFKNIDPVILSDAREIFLSTQKPFVIISDKPYFIDENGNTTEYKKALIITKAEMTMLLGAICDNSVYSVMPNLCRGFVTLRGGHRVGVTGQAVTDNGQITHISEISSINIRIAREVIGAAKGIISSIIKDDGINNTLIISPPGCGKTTLLRDIARILSTEYLYKTAIVDERFEIAATRQGVPSNDVGILTSVMSGCAKKIGMEMMLRSMSPDVIITDEIGTDEDEEALVSVINAGVKVICSAHGYDMADVCKRRSLDALISRRIFKTIIVLSKRCGPCTIEKIYG